MKYKDFNISIQVKDNNVKLLDGVVRGDNTNMINVTLVDGNTPFNFKGYSDIMLSIEGPKDILIKSIVTSEDLYNEDNPYHIHVASAADGRISFNPNGLATSQEGTYFARFILFSGSDILTTARLNYHVCKSDKNISVDIYENSSEYTGLVNLIKQVAAINEAEKSRVDAEAWRKQNEEDRQAAEELRRKTVEEMTALWENFKSVLSSVKEYADEAKRWAEIARTPYVEAIKGVLDDMNLPSDKAEMNELVAYYIGEYFQDGIDGSSTHIKIKVVSTIDSLEPGELALLSTDGNLYIGTDMGNLCITQHIVASTSAPTNLNLLWIDTSEQPSLLKRYNGSSWVTVDTVAVYG